MHAFQTRWTQAGPGASGRRCAGSAAHADGNGHSGSHYHGQLGGFKVVRLQFGRHQGRQALGRRRRPVAARAAAWLRAGGSLTAHLSRLRAPVSVRVLRQGPQTLPGYAQAALALPHGRAVHGRSVLLSGQGRAMVMASSLVGQAASKGPWRAMRGLGQRPLAELLFTRLDVRRSPLQWRWLPPGDPLARQLARAWLGAGGLPLPGRGLWQRSSTFQRHRQALCVSEFFWPAELAGWPAPQRLGPHRMVSRSRGRR